MSINILKINAISNYNISCLFSNGESRIIDLQQFFTSKQHFSEAHPAYKLLQDETEFNQVEIIGNTIGWKNAGIHSTDFEGKPVFYPYDIDPIVLFEYSTPDEERNLNRTIN